MAIFALKQTVDLYRNQDTPVYMCFIDAEKAFDRVNHSTLANKLINRNVPFHIVIFFCFWYTKARVYGTMGYLVINDIPLFKWDQARGTVVIISV